MRIDEAAVRTGDKLNLDFADWTSEVFVRPESWAKSGAATLPLALLCMNNAEVLASNPSGSTLRLVATFRVQDADGNEDTDSTSNMDIASALGSTWHHLACQWETVQGRGCIWWDGVVKGTVTGLTSPLDRIFVKRLYLGLLANTSGADVFIDTSPTTAGVVSFDYWRVSRSARYTHNVNFTPPAAAFADTGSPAYAVYPMRETVTPHVILSNFGQYNAARGRIDAFNDRLAGPWQMTVNATPGPF